MPRQAFYEPRAPRSHNNDLESLAALSQIMNGIQGPAVHQADNQQQNALSVLGLMLQQQHQQDQIGLARTGQVSEDRHRTVLEQQQKAALDQQGQDALLHPFLNDPSIPWEQKLAAIAKLNPQYAEIGHAMHEGAINSMVQKRAPEFSGIYNQNKDNPKGLHTALDALKMTMPEEVFNNQNWDTLNSSLPTSPTAPGTSVGGGIGGGLGSAVRALPLAIPHLLMKGEDAMQNFGSNFWANLFGAKKYTPEEEAAIIAKPVQPFGSLFK